MAKPRKPPSNVIAFTRKPEIEYEPHWVELAKADPVWASKQIWGLLFRAIEAERREAKLRTALRQARLKAEGLSEGDGYQLPWEEGDYGQNI